MRPQAVAGRITGRMVPWLLLAPALAALGFVIVYPAIASFVGSFRLNGDFVGLSNYKALLTDPVFWRSFENNLILLLSIPIRILLALVITAVLYRGVFGARFYSLAIFIPFIPSIAAMGIIFIYLLNANGPFNQALRAIGLDMLTRGWLTDAGLPMWTIMLIIVWCQLGFTVLLFTARLSSVDRELFQAAFIDGASWKTTYTHIALPELKGTIEFVTILNFIEAFSWSFAYVYVLTQGSKIPSNYILEIYLYNKQFLAYLPGVAAAVAVFLMIIVGSLTAVRYARAGVE
jgi:ABC-type sugar transport system permease subunit